MIVESTVKDGVMILKNSSGYYRKVVLRKGQLEAINMINENFMENIVFNAPTAYGKTIVAIYYICKMIKQGLKIIYTAPLKALTAEIVEKLKEMDIKVLEDTGDFRKQPLKDYKNADVVITTYERLDSVMRNPKYHEVFEDFGLLIIDEIHTLHSQNRGVNLESLIVKIKHHTGLSIMGMSATVDNYKTIAEFLDAKYIYVPVEERPVKQNIEVLYYYNEFQQASMRERNDLIRPIINDLIRREKQALVFCSSRKRCEVLAQDFAGIRTKDPLELAKKSNYSFHHAGLPIYQKQEIEKKFLNNEIRFIFCTPTLAMGVNLPAYSVIIYDTCRWNGLVSDNVLIETIEIEQMVGRAGRPQFGEKECEVYILARIQDKPYTFEENIVKSKMFHKLRAVFNEWICSGLTSLEDIKDCLNKTLIRIQSDYGELKKEGGEAMTYLVNNGFINKFADEFTPSFLGRMTALFYIEPETALHFKVIESIFHEKEYSDLELTAMLLNTPEFLEMIRVEEKDAELISLSARAFLEEGIDNKLYDERILKVIPMIFTSHFNQKYAKNIILYRTDAVALSAIMERLLSSAEVIIYDKTLKQRVSDLKIMIKNRTLDRNIAILKSAKGIGDVRMNRLFNAGIKRPEDFLRKSDAELMTIMKVSKKIITDIRYNLKIALKEREMS